MINYEYLPGYMLNDRINPQAQIIINQLKPVYREAFALWPWNERSKCASPDTESLNCVDGLSALQVGELCTACNLCPNETAYTDEELDAKFKEIGQKDSMLYLEREGNGRLILAAVAYKATAEILASEKYSDVPSMEQWLKNECGTQRFVWLDEVFSDRSARPKGNLDRFTNFVPGLASLLNMPDAAVRYRTISPAMTIAPRRFSDGVRVLNREESGPEESVPDRRDFVTIELSSAIRRDRK